MGVRLKAILLKIGILFLQNSYKVKLLHCFNYTFQNTQQRLLQTYATIALRKKIYAFFCVTHARSGYQVIQNNVTELSILDL